MIELQDVHKSYRMGDVVVRALRGISLTIQPGDYVAIMGPSGSGKSTLMNVLGLLDVPDQGSFRLFGRDVATFTEDELAAARARMVGFVFQQFNLLARLTARENTALPLIYTAGREGDKRATELLTSIGLGERLHHRPRELSGGQQQRVAIARALMNEPRVLLADEPTGNLDSASAAEIMAILDQLNARGMTVLLVTHEEDIAAHARRVIRLRDGLVQSDEVKRAATAAPPLPADALAALRPVRFGLREVISHVRQAARALAGNKVRAFLSMLGVLIGVAAVIAMLALGKGAQLAIEQQMASLGSNMLVLRPGASQQHGVMMEAGSVTRLRAEDGAALALVPEVNRVAPSVQGMVQVTYNGRNWRTRVVGTTPPYASMRASQPLLGRFLTEAEERSRARVAVIGMTLVRELFQGGNPIGEVIKVNRVSFQVIGILPEKGASSWRDEDDQMIIPLSTAMRRLLGRDYVESIDIEVRSADVLAQAQSNITSVMRALNRLQPHQADGFTIRNMAEIQSALSSTSRTMSVLLAVIATISLIVGGIGIMNIMLVSVTERTREIGIRKAIGARRRDILGQFLIEAVAVSAIGGLLGILLGWGITVAMAQLAGWTTAMSAQSVAMAFLFSAGVGIVFGLWPARKASLLNPIEALRYE